MVANGIGVDSSLPGKSFFDLDKLKIFGYSMRSKTTMTLTYNLAAYRADTTTPDIVPLTVPARIISTVDLSAYLQLKNLTKVSVTYPSTPYIGKTYFIETTFTPH